MTRSFVEQSALNHSPRSDAPNQQTGGADRLLRHVMADPDDHRWRHGGVGLRPSAGKTAVHWPNSSRVYFLFTAPLRWPSAPKYRWLRHSRSFTSQKTPLAKLNSVRQNSHGQKSFVAACG